MKRVLLKNLAQYGRWTSFHLACLAAFLTGLFIASTAGELGPFTPLLVSLGVYAMLFAVIAEILLILRWAISFGCNMALGNESPAASMSDR